MRRLLLLLALGGCGRLGFDATTDGGGADTGPDTGEDRSYRSAVLADKPVGYWRFGDANRIIDEVGGPDGVASGGCMFDKPGALAGDVDRAIRFSGCVVDLGAGLAFLGSSPFTVEAWVASDNNSSFEHIITKQLRDEFNPIDGYALLDSPTGVYFERVVAPGGGGNTNELLLTNFLFTYAVGVFDGTRVRLYVDGVQIGAPQPAGEVATPYAANVLVGAARRGSGSLLSHFNGSIDEVAIYDHVLPPARILEHYQIGRGP